MAELYLYNSKSRKKDLLKTKEEKRVGMYVCGVTAYDFSHIGHARVYVAFDVLYRYLKYLGYDVIYVRNYTDVDDKIINKANEYKEENPDHLLSDPLRLSNHYCDEFLKDMDDLQCLRPHHQPKVSEHMDQIQHMITKILDKGYAYPLEGDVYFAAGKFPKYGQLSRRKLEDNRAGTRVAVDSRKQHPADFALWKAAKLGEPSWNSPWSRGRPGWHIECSAMGAHYLSYSFDIHGGGIDLIFPHHENELAQSCAASENTHISHWMHNGYVTINGEKMSKSTGNYITIREVTGKYHPLALRYFLLSTNYRSPVDFTWSQMDLASEAVYRVYQTLQDCRDVNKNSKSNGKLHAKPSDAKKLKKDFECKMSDDLNTAEVLKGSLQDAVKAINNELNRLKKNQKQQTEISLQSLADLEEAIEKVLDVLGLLARPYSEVLLQLKEKALIRATMSEDEVLRFIEERDVARQNRDFVKSDMVRNELTSKGISLMDLPTGTTWRPCVPEEIV